MSIYNFLDDIGLTRVFEKLKAKLDAKQDTLVSGTNIKTINDQSVLGSGDLDMHDAFVAVYGTTSYADVVAAIDANKAIVVDFANNHNLFTITYSTYGAAGSDVLMHAIYKSGNDATLATITLTSENAWSIAHTNLQELLVSGTSIKTVNGNSLLGSGDVTISGGGDVFHLKLGVGGTAQIPGTPYADIMAAFNEKKTFCVSTGIGSLGSGVSRNVMVVYTNKKFYLTYFNYVDVYDIWDIVTTWVDENDNWPASPDNVPIQEQLVSGTNIKTINNQSLLGSGNIDIPGGGTVDAAMSDTSENAVQNKVIKSYVDGATGDLTALTTDNKTDLVAAINEVYEKSGEPFRVKQWATNALNVTIVPCTSDAGNTSLDKMVFTIDDVEGASYQVIGMLAYEVFDAASGGNRINCWPVCQFTGNGQKELHVRWMCGGTTNKVAKRINAWVLLKHR